MVIVCGPSGSGKSTLAFDIVYAEGQRRYVESLSTYARQFLPKMDKPDVDKVEGLSPAISLEQQTSTRNPRSTVGTVTEVYDFLRVFFARLGVFHCPQCAKAIEAQTTDQIVDEIMELQAGTRFLLLAPLVEHQKGTHKELFTKLRKEGFARIRVNGKVYSLDEVGELEKNKRHSIELVVDRLIMKPDIKKRVADSVELALSKGSDSLIISIVQASDSTQDSAQDRLVSTLSTCSQCKISMPRLSPQLFSFNSPQGACPACSGLGSVEYFEPKLIAPNKGLSLNQGGIIPWKSAYRQKIYGPRLQKLGSRYDFTLDTPLNKFSEAAWDALFYGDIALDWPGIVEILEFGRREAGVWDDWMTRFRQTKSCPQCHGARLRPETLSVLVQGVNIASFTSMSISKALDWLQSLSFTGQDKRIAEPLLKELVHRLGFMVNVGLEYLSLERNMSTLSGGEAQRIRLASQLGSGLVGVTYVLDEPSIGLHPRDNQRLLGTLRNLQERGNTVLVVEHDEAAIRAADHIIELGPGSGWLGGEVVFQGSVPQLLRKKNSLTAKYLRKDLQIEIPEKRPQATGKIQLKGVNTNNLKNLDVAIPLGQMVCFTGVSGSGKSSLVVDSLYKHIALSRGIRVDNPGQIQGIEGLEAIEKVIAIDQTPIGRTPRSNPATYTKIFDEIRKIFANTKEAKTRGYQPGRFSFNVKGGRCEHCRGDGQIRVEMHFLPDIYVTCEACKGKRYSNRTLEVKYKGQSIDDVLNMTVRQAKKFFEHHPTLLRRLVVLEQVGLEYLRLGQPATTLSGGEAQRIKISRELGKRSLPSTLYILDEPTTGLHMHEVGKLIRVLRELVNKGATVIIIEHNADVVMASDWIFDLGPGGGENGGEIVAHGSPETIISDPCSITGNFLKK